MYYRHWGSFMKVKNILFFGLFLGLIWIGLSNINKSTENLDIDRVKNSLRIVPRTVGSGSAKGFSR